MNPNHDNKGRFASKGGGKSSIGLRFRSGSRRPTITARKGTRITVGKALSRRTRASLRSFSKSLPKRPVITHRLNKMRRRG